jgi:hypothetical protein
MAHPLSLSNNSASILTLPEELSGMIMNKKRSNRHATKSSYFYSPTDCKINVGVEKEEHDL